MAKLLTSVGFLLGLTMVVTMSAQGSPMFASHASINCTTTVLGDIAGCD